MNENETGPKYPEIEVQLTGTDGNAFALLGKMDRALKQAGVPYEEIREFTGQATSGDYDNLLRTCTTWVTVL